MEAVLSNHCAQSPASVCVASPGYTMGHCKVKCSLCSAQQLWCSLDLALRQGWAGCLWGLRFCQILESISDGGCAQQPLRTEPCQCVYRQLLVCHGALQGQIQSLQGPAGVLEPALVAAAGLGRWFVGVAVLPDSGEFQ